MHQSYLSKGERQLLQKLESLGVKAATMSITELSEELCFSTATISRLIKKMGYVNIKEYKKILLSDMLSSNDSEESISEVNKIQYKRSIIDTANNILTSNKIYLVNDIELDSLVIGLNLRKFQVELVSLEYIKNIDLEIDDIIMIYSNTFNYYEQLKKKFPTNRFILLNNEDKIYEKENHTTIINSIVVEAEINNTTFNRIHISSQQILMEIDKRLSNLYVMN